ncbi:MAG: biopolymer transporter ExbD [Acidobacteriota bacterium]|nr:biopolymer transporter ExbD [Acidobacteriota bacterium]
MSISIRKGPEKAHAEPNVVPLCDVLLVLLIIFMVVTPLVQKGVDVRLPAAMNATNMPDNPEVVVYLKKDGTIYLNSDKVTNLEALQGMLEEEFLTVTEKKLYLKADGELPYGTLIDLYEKIRAAGIENIAIITERRTEKG